MTTKILRYNKETGNVDEFEKSKAPTSGEMLFLGNNGWSTGLTSLGAGCHSSQVQEFREDLDKSGISGVEITNSGAVKFYSRAARRKYMEYRGLVDRDAGYGDAAPKNY